MSALNSSNFWEYAAGSTFNLIAPYYINKSLAYLESAYLSAYVKPYSFKFLVLISVKGSILVWRFSIAFIT